MQNSGNKLEDPNHLIWNDTANSFTTARKVFKSFKMMLIQFVLILQKLGALK